MLWALPLPYTPGGYKDEIGMSHPERQGAVSMGLSMFMGGATRRAFSRDGLAPMLMRVAIAHRLPDKLAIPALGHAGAGLLDEGHCGPDFGAAMLGPGRHA